MSGVEQESGDTMATNSRPYCETKVYECPFACEFLSKLLPSLKAHLRRKHQFTKEGLREFFRNYKDEEEENDFFMADTPRPKRFQCAWKSSKRFEKGFMEFLQTQLTKSNSRKYMHFLLLVLAGLCENKDFLPHRIFEPIYHRNTLIPIDRIRVSINSYRSFGMKLLIGVCVSKFLEYIEYWVRKNSVHLEMERRKQLLDLVSNGNNVINELTVTSNLVENNRINSKSELLHERQTLLKILCNFVESSYLKGIVKNFIDAKDCDIHDLKNTLLYLLMIECNYTSPMNILNVTMDEFESHTMEGSVLVIHSNQTKEVIPIIVMREMVQDLLLKYVGLRKNKGAECDYLFTSDSGSKIMLFIGPIKKLKRDIQNAGLKMNEDLVVTSVTIRKCFKDLQEQIPQMNEFQSQQNKFIHSSIHINQMMSNLAQKARGKKRKSLDSTFNCSKEISNKKMKRRRRSPQS